MSEIINSHFRVLRQLGLTGSFVAAMSIGFMVFYFHGRGG